MAEIIKSKYTVRVKSFLIPNVRRASIAAILISLLASTAWAQGQPKANVPGREGALPALIKALDNTDQRVRYTAALALSGVRSGEQRYPDVGELPKPIIPILPKQVIPILIKALKDQDPVVRSDAAWALAGIGAPAKAAATALIESVEDRDLEVCRYAACALKNVGGKSPAVIHALIRLLKHPDQGIQDVANEALVNIRETAVPSLVRLLIGQDSALRVKSHNVLRSIGDVFALVATLKSRDKALRSRVLEVIEDIRVDPARDSLARKTSDLLFDPSRKYLFTTVRIPCTYEHDGRAIFVSDLDTGKSFPILASSGGIGPSGFIEAGGRSYLVIDESGGEANCSAFSFWLYDVKANAFVIHAEGGLGEAERGVFPLTYCEGGKATTVTTKNLLNRERPLRLLPRPRHGLTLTKNTKAFNTCNQGTNIRNAGTRVLITEKREDGSYEVYYNGVIATVPKGSLKTTK